MAFTADEIRANRDYFAQKLRAEKQRNDVLKAVEGGAYDFVLLDARGREPCAAESDALSTVFFVQGVEASREPSHAVPISPRFSIAPPPLDPLSSRSSSSPPNSPRPPSSESSPYKVPRGRARRRCGPRPFSDGRDADLRTGGLGYCWNLTFLSGLGKNGFVLSRKQT